MKFELELDFVLFFSYFLNFWLGLRLTYVRQTKLITWSVI